MSELDTEAVAAKVEELKGEESFDLSATLKGTSYPTDDVTVFLNGEKAHELNTVLNEISELGFESAKYSAEATGGMTDAPEKEEIDKQIEALEVRQKELIAEITGSALTFKLRGAAPEIWKIIIKRWKRKAKKEEGLEDDQERQEWAGEKIDDDLLSTCIVQVTNAKGQVNKGAYKLEQAEEIRNRLLESEYAKIIDAVNVLTFANTVFHNAIAADADFLSKP